MPRCSNLRCQANYPSGSMQCTNPFCKCFLPDAMIAGRYRIEALMGLGGMGAVYRAYDTLDMQYVALKVILASENADEATAAERFRREARYARQLQHKNIVPVLNFGQDGTLLYLVMPLVTGGTLKSLLAAEQPLPLAQTQRYLSELAEAIDAVHAHPQQIVHRDIKPSNLLIHQSDGRLVLADFGIARAMQRERALTQRGWALGTEHYVAPEQSNGKAEPASDVYSMGVVAYQMLTGLLPFQAIVRSHSSTAPSPSTLNPALPPAVDTVIQRAMALEPAKRYPSGRAFADALNAALKTVPTTGLPTVTPNVGSANMLVRSIVPDNPCLHCGQENRSSSSFCRHCGGSLHGPSPLVTEVYQVGYVSDSGRRFAAEGNEDMLLVVQGLCINLALPPRPFGLFAVADGLRSSPEQGKPASGHEASRLALQVIADELVPRLATPKELNVSAPLPSASSPPRRLPQLVPPPDNMVVQWLADAARQANRVIRHCNDDFGTTMASTLTAALMYKRHLYVASVGDSRAYHYSPTKGLHRITIDHTTAAHLVQIGLFQPEDLYKESSQRDQHERYLGQSNQLQVDLFEHRVEVDDLVLLCTDGFWHMVRDERLAEILAQGGDPQQLARSLVKEANVAGGEGNISAIVVRML